MWWLWYVAPLAGLVVYALTTLSPERARSRLHEIQAWKASFQPPAKAAPKANDTKRVSPGDRVKAIPPDLSAFLAEFGGGTPLGYHVLAPKLGYLAIEGANARVASDAQTVLAKLRSPAPEFVARPLPIIDGRRSENDGVTFASDAAFSDEFLVEGRETTAIQKWINESVREALLRMPNVWLRTRGKAMALTLYGSASADEIDELIAVADAIFAEHGADSMASLLGELASPSSESRCVKPERDNKQLADGRA